MAEHQGRDYDLTEDKGAEETPLPYFTFDTAGEKILRCAQDDTIG